MIHEDFVSFETAKLLKKKGFDVKCRAFWKDCKGKIRLGRCIEYCHNSMLERFNDRHELNVAAPALPMAMKWLRNVYDIHPNIVVDDFGTVALYRVERIFQAGCDRHWFDFEPNDNSGGLYSTYEEACEAAIKYCLENLI